MVWHNVHEQFQLVLAEDGTPATKAGLATQVVANPARIDDVVSMAAPGAGLQNRRTVNVTDSEERHVLDTRGGSLERESFG